MNLDYDIRKLTNEQRLEVAKVDHQFIEYAQEQYNKYKKLLMMPEMMFYGWILDLVDRLEEAGYEYERLEEELKEAKQYIEDWNVRPNLGKHFDERF